MNMNINASDFLAATALLVAVLLVWAQLWINTYKLYKNKAGENKTSSQEHNDINTIITLALSWTYLAIAFTVFAFACFALSALMSTSYTSISSSLGNAGIGFLGSSFSMVVIEIAASLWSAFLKFWKSKPFDEPNEHPLNKYHAQLFLLALPGHFLVFSFLASFVNAWWWIGNPVVTLIASAIIIKSRKLT